MPIGCIISAVFCFVVSVPPLEMVSPSLVRIGLVGIELALIPVVGKALGADGKLLVLAYLSSIACKRLVAILVAPLEVGNDCFKEFGFVGIKLSLGGSIFFVWSSERTWQIKAGTSDATAFLALDLFNVSINLVSKRLVVVAVPGTNRNKLSWGNHWSVSWVLVLLVAGL